MSAIKVTARPLQLEKIKTGYENDARSTITQQVEKQAKDKQSYIKFKITWVIIIAAAIMLLFAATANWYKGLALGLLIFGTVALTVDTFLENRAVQYLSSIEKILYSSYQI
jgi:membrane protein YdbS with pleckstrin-like domain